MCVEAPVETSGTTISGHQCQPSRLAGHRAHGTPKGTVVACPCGKRWTVTKTHHDNHGRRGAICGCGWQLLEPAQEAAA